MSNVVSLSSKKVKQKMDAMTYEDWADLAATAKVESDINKMYISKSHLNLDIHTINDPVEGDIIFGGIMTDEEYEGFKYPQEIKRHLFRPGIGDSYLIHAWAENYEEAEEKIHSFLKPYGFEPFLIVPLDEDGITDFIF
ncbi:hypothetical protein [Bacillus piscicola]|uniref:hypothetical protein n=1 Tax=Bacillus piscicola TaxID=1632684 RepID=UPI001F08C478|nr:hypothetical protein [Bacillus piscicola]